MGCPLSSVYKGGRGGGAAGPMGAPGGILLQLGVGLPLLPCSKREEEGRKRKGGRRPPFLVLFRLGGGGARPALAGPPLLPYGPCRPNNPRGVPVTPRYSCKIPISAGTFPISKYRLPIYQSLCLDHFETPCHVRDHIRDSEQPSVHQNTKTLITIVIEL